MKGYVIVNVEVKDPVRYQDYIKAAPPSIKEYGGRYIARGGRTEKLEGDFEPRRVVLLEFPTFERAREWWGSQAYAHARTLRQSCARADLVLVEGCESPV
jgi:uncharacterized protein (DUF1330 family)